MSYDVAVWRRDLPSDTIAAAVALYTELCDRPLDVLSPGPAMAAFVAQIEARFGAAYPGDSKPWAAEPSADEDSVLMAVSRTVAAEAVAIIRDYAREVGFTFFDATGVSLHISTEGPSAPGAPVLGFFDDVFYTNPTLDRIRGVLQSLTPDSWYASIVQDDDNYIQVGIGPDAKAPVGQYALEYRDGSVDRHWRAFTSNVDLAVLAFQQYAQGRMDWTQELAWTPAPDLQP